MPPIPEKTVDEIKNRADIAEVIGSYIQLKQRGSEYWACCPFHKEKTPSFKISSSRQAYYCFGCHKSGNIFTFVMEQENLDFPGACRMLARKYGIVIPENHSGGGPKGPAKEKLFDLMRAISEWYHSRLKTQQGAGAADYLHNRGIPENAISSFMLGYAPDSWDATLKWATQHGFSKEQMIATGMEVENENKNCYDRFRGRLMFPIWDELGRVIGFSGRILDPEAKTAKYVNSPETKLFYKGKVLYGLHLARIHFKEHGFALICEGQLDVIACHRAGLKNALAPQGTAFTEEQARILKRFTDSVVFAFDADTAGIKAAVKSIQTALETGLMPEVVSMPEGEDPDGVLKASGQDALKALIESRIDGFEFLLKNASESNDINTPEGKAEIVGKLIPAIRALDNQINRATRCQWLARSVDMPENVILDHLSGLDRKERRKAPFTQAEIDGAALPALPSVRPGAFSTPHEKAELSLLDLSIHYQDLALQLSERLHPEQITKSPIGQALEFVLRLTAEERWIEAGKIIASDMRFCTAPEIARILVESEFQNLDPETVSVPENVDLEEKKEERRNQLLKAMNDCLSWFEKRDIDSELRSVEEQLAQVSDPEKVRELMQLWQDLVKQKH